jgi:hypothetical protein
VTNKEKSKKLHEIVGALEEWSKYNENVTNAEKWITPAAKQIIRKAMTLLVDNLALLNECRSKYGCHSPLHQCFLEIEQAASLPKTNDLGNCRGWVSDFTERHLWGGEKRSFADECVRYANELNMETEQRNETIKDKQKETLEPIPPEFLQKLLWVIKYGRKHWKIILLAVIILLVSFYVKQKLQHNGSITNINAPSQSSINYNFLDLIKKAVINLDDTEYKGNDFDYWPDGGLRSIYDHLRTFIDYRTLVKISPVPIYLSGPHSDINLSLNERYQFGHYNPEFIHWLDKHISILTEDGDFIKTTKPLFDKYISKTAFAYWECYRCLEKDTKLKEHLKLDYLKHINERNLPVGFYYNIAWDSKEYESINKLSNKYSVNIVAPAIYFWLRRSIDGTDEKIYTALDKLLRAYYPTRIWNLEISEDINGVKSIPDHHT